MKCKLCGDRDGLLSGHVWLCRQCLINGGLETEADVFNLECEIRRLQMRFRRRKGDYPVSDRCDRGGRLSGGSCRKYIPFYENMRAVRYRRRGIGGYWHNNLCDNIVRAMEDFLEHSGGGS